MTSLPDLSSACAREPIHLPGTIQPHGVLFACAGPDWTVRRASANAAGWVGRPAADVVGRGPVEAWAGLRPGERPVPLGPVRFEGRPYEALAHRTGETVVLELEAAPAEPWPPAHPFLDDYLARIESTGTIADLCRVTAAAVRRLTGFDRALVYQFDADGAGTVVGEDRSDRLPSYLGLRFPESDIPRQARELYRLNRLRLIPDAGYTPVPIVPAGAPLDLSFSALRSVSPVHVEYMRNMGTAASMSVSVVRAGRLWGLISCHHADPRFVPLGVRGACDLAGRAFALRLDALEGGRDRERLADVRAAFTRLLAGMADCGEVAGGLLDHPAELLAFADAAGAAVLTGERFFRIGETPREDEVRALVAWLFAADTPEVYHTDHLAADYPPAAAFADTASGLLAVAISKLHADCVLWFRPEVVRTVAWAGDPHKPADAAGRLSPRRSFEQWKETVRGKSVPWRPAEVEGAVELRNAIVGVVLRKAEELADLSAELTRSNKELESFSYSVSHDLRAPLRHVVGYAELLQESAADKLSPTDRRYLRTIIEATEHAGQLMDKLLHYARMGRTALDKQRVDMNDLVRTVADTLTAENPGRRITWHLGPLAPALADAAMMGLVVRNLLENAVKYTRNRPEAVIEVGCRDLRAESIYHVKDNGVGFDPKYTEKLFGIFQRLHRMEDYEGTGIGLANVRRLVSRHGGRTWAESEDGRGATFYFSLPHSTATEVTHAQADPAR
ncbi:MAG TPA: ATP-binding protein [Gemmataceae bacterium]|nr:ATP-binding protein [Gemmataceae bacterium]